MGKGKKGLKKARFDMQVEVGDHCYIRTPTCRYKVTVDSRGCLIIEKEGK
jgi:hypothetical protein